MRLPGYLFRFSTVAIRFDEITAAVPSHTSERSASTYTAASMRESSSRNDTISTILWVNRSRVAWISIAVEDVVDSFAEDNRRDRVENERDVACEARGVGNEVIRVGSKACALLS